MAKPAEAEKDEHYQLRKYEAVWLQSRQMLDTARQGDWDLLIKLERTRAADGALPVKPISVGDSTAVYQEKVRTLIHAILSHDDEIRTLVEPRQQELRDLVAALNTERKLHNAYDAHA